MTRPRNRDRSPRRPAALAPPSRLAWALALGCVLALGAGCAAGGGSAGAAGGVDEDGIGGATASRGAAADGVDSLAAPAPLRALLIVSQENERGVAFLNADSRKVIALARVGWSPREIAVSPDGERAYVVNDAGDSFGAGSISVLDTRDRHEIDRINLYPYGAFHGLVAGRNGIDLYVASELRHAVLRVNLATRQVEHAWPLPHGTPHLLALDPTETRIYVTDATGPSLFAINVGTGDVQEARVGNGPEAVVLTPDGSALWVANRDDDSITALDPFTLIPLATLAAGRAPMRIAFDPDMRHAVVVNAGESSVMIFDARTRARLATVPVDGDPLGVAIEPDGSRAYVTSTRDNLVDVVDLAANTVTGRAQVGITPWGIAWVDMTR